MNLGLNKNGHGHSALFRVRRGSLLVESTVAIVLLIALGIVVLRGSLSAIEPRRWTMLQTMTDAYLSQEVALAKRIDWNDIMNLNNVINPNSPWQPAGSARTDVTVNVGIYPTHLRDNADNPIGNRTATATVVRTATTVYGGLSTDFDGANNHITDAENPLRIEAVDLRSTLIYQFNGKTYSKTRVVRRQK